MNHVLSIMILIFISNLVFINSLNTFDIPKLKISSKTDQIMIVVPNSYESHLATFYYYIKKNNFWLEVLKSEAHIGKNGLGKKIEGDKKTPVGVYKFNKYFGIADNPGTKMPYIKLNNSLYWDGDSNSERYNQMVNIETYTNFDTSESEHLIEETLGYQYAMNVNYNELGVPKKGAGIFLHCYTEREYTAGCVALPHKNMETVMIKVSKDALILIDVLENIYNY